MESNEYRQLTSPEIGVLENRGCAADSWDMVRVRDGFQVTSLTRVQFHGENFLGVFSGKIRYTRGLELPAGITDARLFNCRIGDNVYIQGPIGLIANYRIGDGAVIIQVDRMVYEGPTRFGNGIPVSVLNEAGGREVPMFDRLSAHLAYILALYRYRPDVIGKITAMIEHYADGLDNGYGVVGEGSRITHTHLVRNVKIGPYAQIDGVTWLEEGSINSNALDPVYIGPGVSARDFIISSGSVISGSVFLDKCFVGQGVELGKQYSAENSLFFANCAGFHGEACSVFAGPFTVTHHKSTLLIAAYFSFLNAGSGSNQSNHMYKLGPIHQGIVERGSKTTSDSYLLWPSKIGPFTLVMGRHYKNSDTSDLPFSYLVESNDESILSPGVNLRSVGTIRDAQKWPKRDRRKDTDQLDLINYNLLSPFTIQKMWRGREILRDLQKASGTKSDFYSYENTRIPGKALERGIQLYSLGICKFLGNSLISRIIKFDCKTTSDLVKAMQPASPEGRGKWVDLAGLITPQELVVKMLDRIGAGETLSIPGIENEFKRWHHDYYDLEWTWARDLFQQEYNVQIETITPGEVIEIVRKWKVAVVSLDEMLYEDARKEFRISAHTGFGSDGGQDERTLDFSEVRGEFEKNPTVVAIREHILHKTELGDQIISRFS